MLSTELADEDGDGATETVIAHDAEAGPKQVQAAGAAVTETAPVVGDRDCGVTET